MVCASERLSPQGFSTNTCLPAFRQLKTAGTASLACMTTTAFSPCSAFSISSRLSYVRAFRPNALTACAECSRLLVVTEPICARQSSSDGRILFLIWVPAPISWISFFSI
jgi:hypothetical protein